MYLPHYFARVVLLIRMRATKLLWDYEPNFSISDDREWPIYCTGTEAQSQRISLL